MFNRIVLIATLSATTILLVMLNFTTPTALGPLGVLFFFLMVYIIMFGISALLVSIFRKLLQKRGNMARKDYLYAAVIAFAPIMLLLAQSLGTINIFTVILTIVFISLGCFLVNRRA